METNPTYRVVFFGTPGFAVPSLEALAGRGHTVVCVVTQPDRLRGRGRKPAVLPVKAAALEKGFDLVQPASVRETAFVDRIKRLDPDLFVLVAFGQLLPEALLTIPKLGAVNVHASLLPRYRGPAPIQWAIINGDTVTGVTTMLMDKGMDTGDILLRRQAPIGPEDTAATLHDRLAELGAELLTETLASMADGSLVPVAQDPAEATFAPLLKKGDGRIDWRAPARRIGAFIRGMNPWPGAFTFCNGKRLKIFAAAEAQTEPGAVPGTVIRGFAGELRIAAGQGALSVTEIQGESGKRLPTPAFLAGCPMPPGTVLA